MVSEKQTFDNLPDKDQLPFTTLRSDMEADGFPEETISLVIGKNQDNPAAAREVYGLLRDSKVRRGELPAGSEREAGRETPVPMSVQEQMGAKAVGDTGTWRISGSLDDEPVVEAKAAVKPNIVHPPELTEQKDKPGQDLSEEGIRAWVRQNHGR
jgi:hypothetical protein